MSACIHLHGDIRSARVCPSTGALIIETADLCAISDLIIYIPREQSEPIAAAVNEAVRPA